MLGTALLLAPVAINRYWGKDTKTVIAWRNKRKMKTKILCFFVIFLAAVFCPLQAFADNCAVFGSTAQIAQSANSQNTGHAGIAGRNHRIVSRLSANPKPWSAPLGSFNDSVPLSELTKKNATFRGIVKRNLAARNKTFESPDFRLSDFSGSDFRASVFSNAEFGGMNLEDSCFTGAKLNEVNLSYADLDGAVFVAADIGILHSGLNGTGVSFSNASLVGADFTQAELKNVNFVGADMLHSHFVDTLIGKSVSFKGANVGYMVFEPREFAGSQEHEMHFAKGLSLLRYETNREPLYLLKNYFKEAGKARAERSVTASLRRSDLDFRLKVMTEKLADTHSRDLSNFLSVALKLVYVWVQIFFWTVMFDMTVEFGASKERVFFLIPFFSMTFACFYWCMLRFPYARFPLISRLISNAGSLQLVFYREPPKASSNLNPKGTSQKLEDHKRIALKYKENYSVPYFPNNGQTPKEMLISRIRHELFAIKIAVNYSLYCSLRFGFRDLDVANWVNTLKKYKYEFHARGRIKTLGGVQSLLSLYLLALYVLCIFDNPFSID